MAVYAIVHKPSGRVYVGSSILVAARWSYHRIVLRKHVHENPVLQACWDADGSAAFEWRILEAVEDAAQLIPREQHWMDELGATNPLRGFNILPTAGSFRGRTLTEEHKRKLSAASKGHPVSAEQRAKIAAKAMGNHRGIDNLTRFRETRMLSAEVVRQVRVALAAGASRASVMTAFSLPEYTVGRIMNGRCYPDVAPELLPEIHAAKSVRRRGENGANVKLTENAVREIKAQLARGESLTSIALARGVTPGAISQIKQGRAWAYVTLQLEPSS